MHMYTYNYRHLFKPLIVSPAVICLQKALYLFSYALNIFFYYTLLSVPAVELTPASRDPADLLILCIPLR